MSLRFHFGPCVLDTATRELRRHGQPVALQARVFECLLHLIEHRDRAVTRDELVRAVFRRSDVSDAQLGQVIVRTRRAVGDDGQSQHTVLTVPRYGFRWVAEVRVEAGTGESPREPASGPQRHSRPEADAEAGSGLEAEVEADAQTNARTDARAEAEAAAQPGLEPLPRPDVGAPTPIRPPLQPGPGQPRVPGRHARSIATAGLLLALAAMLAALWKWEGSTTGDAILPAGATSADMAVVPEAPGALLVLPTEVADGADLAWVRLGLMDYIGDRLRRGGLAVLSSESALAAHARGAAGDPEHLRALLGRGWRVESEALPTGEGWSVRLAARDADGVTQAASADAPDLLEAARVAADRLAPRLGGTAPAGSDSPALGERLQRARAAMLAGELDAARAILLAAPELQRAQPRLQYQLARVDFRAGAHAEGLARLDRLLAEGGASEPLFRAQVLNARGAMLVRLERLEEAEATYDAAELEAGGHPPELGQALSGRAVVHAMDGRFDQALSDFSRARVALRSAGDALAVARIDANLGILENDRGRPAQALPLLAQAEAAFAGMGAVNELATALGARANAELRLLRVEDALATSGRGMAVLDRVADPAQRAELVRARAAALRVAGKPGAAEALLAGVPPPGPGLSAELGAGLLAVQLALDRGQPARALALADAALDAVPAGVQPEVRAWLELRREQAAAQVDRPSRRGSEPGLGTFVPDRLRAALGLVRSGHPAAEVEAAFADALSLAERQGVPGAIAEVVLLQTDWLLEQGRPAEASALANRIAPWARGSAALVDLQSRIEGADHVNGDEHRASD